ESQACGLGALSSSAVGAPVSGVGAGAAADDPFSSWARVVASTGGAVSTEALDASAGAALACSTPGAGAAAAASAGFGAAGFFSGRGGLGTGRLAVSIVLLANSI